MTHSPTGRSSSPSRELGIELTPRIAEGRNVGDLRQFGFVGRVSDKALAEIRHNERRQARALAAAHLFVFGGNNV